MKQVLIKKGKAYIEEVPAPTIGPNTILVKVYYSCISSGTEASGLASSGESLWKKAINQPQKIAKAFDHVKKQGIVKTIDKVKDKVDQSIPTGYSAAGEVFEVGKNIKNIQIGDKVACAGTGIANHAEYIEVPKNLFVKIPSNVKFDEASTVALGSIAMQGVRRTDVKLGEYIAVIGLGILGQITVQLLKANGCHVIGTDVSKRRIQKALSLGLDEGVNAQNEELIKKATQFSNGYDVDSVIITAATDSPKPLSQAFQMCRKKGKVVLVGVVGMEINREDMYKKETDFLISTSYGPGRYDEKYEKNSIDYPYAYVRWTESRNMEEYLNLISEKKIQINPLIEKIYRIEDVSKAYEEIQSNTEKPLISLLKYDSQKMDKLSKKVETKAKSVKKEGQINLALIGAGEFAKSEHLPNINKLKDYYNLQAIVSKTGGNAKLIAQKYDAAVVTTEYQEVLKDKTIDAVLISTRHNLHAKIAIDALNAGKAVFLEKPMALHKKEFDGLIKTIEKTKMPFMVGFNRRFSKYSREAKKHISMRKSPMIINYQMNAGYIPSDHWVHNEEGGGRLIGEACHIFDLFNFFTESEIKSINVDKITPKSKYFSSQDNAVITIKYKDGSLCTLTYTALGHKSYPKETCYIYFDGKIIVINNFEKIEGYGLKIKNLKSKKPDKGQYKELIEFAKYLKGEIQAPIPLWQIKQATEISFIAEQRSS